MSNSTAKPPTAPSPKAIDRTVRRAIVAELPIELRVLRRRVLTETMANGVPVRPAALCAVLAAHNDVADAPLTFTAEHIEELLWYGVNDYCEDIGLVIPVGCAEALHAVLATASALDFFDANSDPIADVFGAFHQLAAS